MSAFDSDLAATLTEEELEAINDTEVSPGDLDTLKEIADGASDSDEDDDGEDDGSAPDAPPVEGKQAAQDAKAEAPVATQLDEPEEPKTQKRDFRPEYKAELPADYEQTIEGLKTQEQDLKLKFRSGEIDFDEYEMQRDQLVEQRDQLKNARVKAEISSEMREQTAAQQWESTVNSFLDSVTGEVNYRSDPSRWGELDDFVKALAKNPANAARPTDWFLAEAHRRVLTLNDLQPRAAKADGKPVAPNRKPPIDAAPKTLAQVPGSDGPGDVNGEFAHLDSLEGQDLEDAIAKMSSSQRAKFMQV